MALSHGKDSENNLSEAPGTEWATVNGTSHHSVLVPFLFPLPLSCELPWGKGCVTAGMNIFEDPVSA